MNVSSIAIYGAALAAVAGAILGTDRMLRNRARKVEFERTLNHKLNNIKVLLDTIDERLGQQERRAEAAADAA